MEKLKGSKTEANLMSAFTLEAMAKTKYEFYESKAKKEGYVQIASIFKETSDNEKAHAMIWFKLLHGGIKETLNNLQEAVNGEYNEWSDMYTNYAKEAREEGFLDIATLFEAVGKIEKQHENRYQKLVDNIQDKKVFEKQLSVEWICNHCGHIHEGKGAPAVCPVCAHPQGYFKVRKELC